MDNNKIASEQLKQIKELVDKVYLLKNESTRAEKEFKVAKNELTTIMTNAEVDKMVGDTCNASRKLKCSVTVPKEHKEKFELIEYIASKDLDEEQCKTLIDCLSKAPVLFDLVTINARSFSAWYDKEIEAKMLEGDVEFTLPMLSPYEYWSVDLRKRAVK